MISLKKKDHTSRSGPPALDRWPHDMQSNGLTLSYIPNYAIWVLINLIYSMIEAIKHLKVDNVCFFYFKQLCNITDGRRHWIAAVPSLENIRAHQSFSTSVWRSRMSACQQSNWYESINRPMITKSPSSPRRGGWSISMYASWSGRRERRRFITTKKETAMKNTIEQTFSSTVRYSPLE